MLSDFVIERTFFEFSLGGRTGVLSGNLSGPWAGDFQMHSTSVSLELTHPAQVEMAVTLLGESPSWDHLVHAVCHHLESRDMGRVAVIAWPSRDSPPSSLSLALACT